MGLFKTNDINKTLEKVESEIKLNAMFPFSIFPSFILIIKVSCLFDCTMCKCKDNQFKEMQAEFAIGSST